MKRKIEFSTASALPQLEGPIITWCNQLQNTKVAELEFHQNRPYGSQSTSNIIISLTDGSKYLLQRRIKHVKQALVPHFVDTIENISSSIATPPLIRVKFSIKSDKCPDLLFILSVCYGIQSHGRKDHVARFFIDDDFFALAIILNVTRTWPTSNVAPETSQSTHEATPLECLWNEVYHSIQHQEHTFWGHTIADETKNTTRELIYRAARSNIAARLPRVPEETNLLVAASIVARVESIIKKRELNESNTWDDAWNESWNLVWESFGSEPANWQIQFQEIWPTENVSGGSNKPVAEGRAPGSIAGRTPERYSLHVNDTTWLHSVLMGHHPSLTHNAEHNSKGKRRGLYPYGVFGTVFNVVLAVLWAMLAGELDPRYEAKLLPATHTLPSDRGICTCSPNDRSIPEDAHNHEVWASPREMAVHRAWEAAWRKSVEMGNHWATEILAEREPGATGETDKHDVPTQSARKAAKAKVKAVIGRARRLRSIKGGNDLNQTQGAPPVQTAPPQNNIGLSHIRPFPIPPNYRRRSTVGSQALRKRLFGLAAEYREQVERELQELAKERTYRDKKEIARLEAKNELLSTTKLASKVSLIELNKWAEEAWDKKTSGFGGLNTKKDSLAEQAWLNLLERSGRTIPDDATKTEWKTNFNSTWEKAWKDSWVKAWQAVWDDAWDAAVARGAEFGVEEVFDKQPNLERANYENLKSKQAYLDVVKSINQGDHLTCLEEVRSMMKELYRLYESLQHSIPVYRDETLQITGFENINDPKAKAKKFRPTRKRHNEERKPTHLSYFELQEWVEKHYIIPKFPENQNGQKLFKRRIAQVWGTALNVYTASSKSSALARAQAAANRPPLAAHTRSWFRG